MDDYNLFERIRRLFWETATKKGRTHPSKHRRGRADKASESWLQAHRAKRRRKNKAASKMRAVQRRRDRQSSKRQRS